jgi:uncharacterized protein
VKLNKKVTVTVTEIDVARKRIGLSMKSNATAPKQEYKKPVVSNNQRKAPMEAKNPFQAKLMELKKKFND